MEKPNVLAQLVGEFIEKMKDDLVFVNREKWRRDDTCKAAEKLGKFIEQGEKVSSCLGAISPHEDTLQEVIYHRRLNGVDFVRRSLRRKQHPAHGEYPVYSTDWFNDDKLDEMIRYAKGKTQRWKKGILVKADFSLFYKNALALYCKGYSFKDYETKYQIRSDVHRINLYGKEKLSERNSVYSLNLVAFEPLEKAVLNVNQHPNLADFNSKKYYFDKKVHRQIRNFLDNKKNRTCLITGDPGSGKSAMAKIYGFEFGIDYVGYYSGENISERTTKELKKDIEKTKNEKVLLIIDNAHLSVVHVSEIVGYFNGLRGTEVIDSQLLVVSRNITNDYPIARRGLYSNVLEKCKVDVSMSLATLKAVIKIRKPNKICKIGEWGIIFKKCEGDYYLLEYYLNVWEENQHLILSEIEEHLVLQDVYNRYILPNIDIKNELFAIAVLSEFEIISDLNWKKIKSERTKLSSLSILRSIENNVINGVYIFHSNPAKYILLAAEHKGLLESISLTDFKIEIYKDYLKCYPSNLMDFFNYLPKRTFEIFITKHQSETCEALVHYFKRLNYYQLESNIEMIFHTLKIIRCNHKETFEKLVYILTSRFKNKIFKLPQISSSGHLLRDLIDLLDFCNSDTVNLLDWEFLKNEIQKKRIIQASDFFFLRFNFHSNKRFLPFSNGLNFSNLGKSVPDNLNALVEIIENLGRHEVSTENILLFVKELDLEKIAKSAHNFQLYSNSIILFLIISILEKEITETYLQNITLSEIDLDCSDEEKLYFHQILLVHDTNMKKTTSWASKFMKMMKLEDTDKLALINDPNSLESIATLHKIIIKEKTDRNIDFQIRLAQVFHAFYFFRRI